MDQSCDYHSNREAVDKCQRCFKLICASDKQYAPSNRYQGQKVLCPHCYYEVAKSSKGGIFDQKIGIAISVIVLVFFGLMLLFIGAFSGSTFITVFFGGFIVVAIIVINLGLWMARRYSAPSIDVTQARQLSLQLRKSSSVQQSDKVEFCMNCGASVRLADSSCFSCGEPLRPAK